MARRRFLFIHQNFPGQFVHAAAELARLGHEVVALGVRGKPVPGVKLVRYLPKAPAQVSQVDPARDFEIKVVRGLACARAMEKLRHDGFDPDVVVAHPAWGEAIFCKDVWPGVRLVAFAEFFYSAEGADFAFDPEFSQVDFLARARLRLKNTVHLLALQDADTGYTPTRWQHRQLPAAYRDKFRVIFDGIDTHAVAPSPGAFVVLKKQNLRLAPGDEVITFVNRNLEPYRGFHIFMRALPEILRRRPNARCLIVGRDGVSYGVPPKSGGSWLRTMLDEVGARLPLERVHFLGALPYADYLRVLQVSACHVYLTYPFVLSWSCLEAMSAGCTVVASRTGPVTEVIEHGKNGLLFDFFDVEGLARQIVSVLADRQAHSELGRRARQRIVERYDLRTKCLPELLALIQNDE